MQYIKGLIFLGRLEQSLNKDIVTNVFIPHFFFLIAIDSEFFEQNKLLISSFAAITILIIKKTSF
jgi:hypothetical protein